MKTLIKNLCGKLEDWGIDPLTLLKAIGIFLVVLVIVTYPILFIILLTAILCVLLIGLIYTIIE